MTLQDYGINYLREDNPSALIKSIKKDKILFSVYNKYKVFSLLFLEAVAKGDAESVRILMNTDLKIDKKRAITLACNAGRANILMLLGSSPSNFTQNNLLICCRLDRIRCANYLMFAGVKPNDLCLQSACMNSSVDLVNSILLNSKGCGIDYYSSASVCLHEENLFKFYVCHSCVNLSVADKKKLMDNCFDRNAFGCMTILLQTKDCFVTPSIIHKLSQANQSVYQDLVDILMEGKFEQDTIIACVQTKQLKLLKLIINVGKVSMFENMSMLELILVIATLNSDCQTLKYLLTYVDYLSRIGDDECYKHVSESLILASEHCKVECLALLCQYHDGPLTEIQTARLVNACKKHVHAEIIGLLIDHYIFSSEESSSMRKLCRVMSYFDTYQFSVENELIQREKRKSRSYSL